MFLNNYIKPQEIISSKSICGSCQFSRENRNYNQINISVHAMTTWRARNKCFWYNRLNCPPELLLLLLVFTATMVLNKTYSRYNTWWNLYTRKLSLLQSFKLKVSKRASEINMAGWGEEPLIKSKFFSPRAWVLSWMKITTLIMLQWHQGKHFYVFIRQGWSSCAEKFIPWVKCLHKRLRRSTLRSLLNWEFLSNFEPRKLRTKSFPQVILLESKRTVLCLSNTKFSTNFFASHILKLDDEFDLFWTKLKVCQINLITLCK